LAFCRVRRAPDRQPPHTWYWARLSLRAPDEPGGGL